MLIDQEFYTKSLENTYKAWKDGYEKVPVSRKHAYLLNLASLYGYEIIEKFKVYLAENR